MISEFAKFGCGVPQGSVFGTAEILYLYVLPIGSIMRHHDIDFHIYADDSCMFLWICQTLDRINLCISDLQIWMIRNKLKMNDSKTEFLIITFYRL